MARKQRDSGRSPSSLDPARVKVAEVAEAVVGTVEGAAPEDTTDPGQVPQMSEPVVAALPDTSAPPLAAAPAPALDKDQELAALRVQLAAALTKADLQLGAATQKLLEAEDLRRRSMPPPPTEANEARVRAARLSAELAELRIERDEQKRLSEDRGAAAASLSEQVATLQAALEVREARAALSETQRGEAQRKAEDEATHALAHQSGLANAQRELAEARALAEELAKQKAELVGKLELNARDSEGLRAELKSALEEHTGRLREQAERAQAELLAAQRQAQEREQQIVQEVRDREVRMVAEVQAREAQLVAAAQSREAQLITEAKASLQATLQAQAQESEQLEGLRREVRGARLELDSCQERVGRAEAHAQELLSTVDSLGRERAALRAEAGAMRARVEELQVAQTRIVKLQAEVDELRGENDFLNQEVARYASAASSHAPPPLPGKS